MQSVHAISKDGFCAKNFNCSAKKSGSQMSSLSRKARNSHQTPGTLPASGRQVILQRFDRLCRGSRRSSEHSQSGSVCPFSSPSAVPRTRDSLDGPQMKTHSIKSPGAGLSANEASNQPIRLTLGGHFGDTITCRTGLKKFFALSRNITLECLCNE